MVKYFFKYILQTFLKHIVQPGFDLSSKVFTRLDCWRMYIYLHSKQSVNVEISTEKCGSSVHEHSFLQSW